MEYNNEIEEGIINIPKAMNITNQFFTHLKPKNLLLRQNSLFSNMKKAPFILKEKVFRNRDILSKTTKIDKYRYNMKIEDNLSTTTKDSNHDKLKKVTFSIVEIIRVENYKKYNKLNYIKKVENENINDSYYKICSIF